MTVSPLSMEDDRDWDIFARFMRLEESRNEQLIFRYQTTPASLSFHCKQGDTQSGGKGVGGEEDILWKRMPKAKGNEEILCHVLTSARFVLGEKFRIA
ncbi:hypothetical protein CDAR_551281 [Caerostris darwini]|uniref:Uncharacterized protein n=1 Tax=Caerostris darwini TaxID=1538125 RepID=A0AAV4V6B8_9ARAC|nr:hypothetical protein CDAR_551281 [Caerostris darwini]